jgi:hypothetical protein
MKKTGTGRFRQREILNKPIQDGIKAYLLCDVCEKEFGKREDWFKRNVFDPYLLDSKSVYKISDELIYFVVSILWRVLIYFKEDGNQYHFKDKLDSAATEWNKFLSKNEPLKSFNNINLVFVPEDIIVDAGGEKSFSYLLRAVDIEIAEDDKKAFVYAKFSRFILFGSITGMSEHDFKGTNIYKLDIVKPSEQRIDENDVTDFILNRTTNMMSYKDLSLPQQKQNDKYFSSRLEKIKGNDFWHAFKKDIENNL